MHAPLIPSSFLCKIILLLMIRRKVWRVEKKKIKCWKIQNAHASKIFSWKVSFRKLSFSLSLPGMKNMKNEENNKNKQCIIMPLREWTRTTFVLPSKRGATKARKDCLFRNMHSTIDCAFARERKTICMSIESKNENLFITSYASLFFCLMRRWKEEIKKLF